MLGCVSCLKQRLSSRREGSEQVRQHDLQQGPGKRWVLTAVANRANFGEAWAHMMWKVIRDSREWVECKRTRQSLLIFSQSIIFNAFIDLINHSLKPMRTFENYWTLHKISAIMEKGDCLGGWMNSLGQFIRNSTAPYKTISISHVALSLSNIWWPTCHLHVALSHWSFAKPSSLWE